MIRTHRRAALPFALAAALLVAWSGAGCQGGVLASHPSELLALAPPDTPCKVVTLEIACERATVVADSFAVEKIERMPGVYVVRRGSERNVIHVLMDDFARPESIGERLEPSCTTRIVGVLKP